MTYDAKETGRLTGNPVYLYRFTRDGVNYDYANTPESLVVTTPVSSTFVASSLTHGKTIVSGRPQDDKVSITFPRSDTFAQLFVSDAGYYLATTVTIWRLHYDDPDNGYILEFSGRVKSGRPSGLNSIDLVCVGEQGLLQAPSFGAAVHRSCRWVLYRTGCSLDVASFQVAATITDLTGRVLTVTEAAAQDDGWYAFGQFTYNGYNAFIVKHVGDELTVRTVPPGLATALSGGPVAGLIARGCNRSFTVCKDKFGNELNFGGFQAFPQEDPFNDGSVV